MLSQYYCKLYKWELFEVTNFGRVEQNIMKGDILGCFEPVHEKCIFNANTEFDFDNYATNDKIDSETLEIPAKERVGSVIDVSNTQEIVIGEGTVKNREKFE